MGCLRIWSYCQDTAASKAHGHSSHEELVCFCSACSCLVCHRVRGINQSLKWLSWCSSFLFLVFVSKKGTPQKLLPAGSWSSVFLFPTDLTCHLPFLSYLGTWKKTGEKMWLDHVQWAIDSVASLSFQECVVSWLLSYKEREKMDLCGKFWTPITVFPAVEIAVQQCPWWKTHSCSCCISVGNGKTGRGMAGAHWSQVLCSPCSAEVGLCWDWCLAVCTRLHVKCWLRVFVKAALEKSLLCCKIQN